MTNVQISGAAAPTALGCTPATNQLGAHAFTSTALGQVNPTLSTDIQNGTTNVLVDWLQLDDLTGTADPSLVLGVFEDDKPGGPIELIEVKGPPFEQL